MGDLIGAGSAQEQAVIGETPNLAARLQALAEPNSIVIAESTRRQIGALFEVADLGPQSLKGFADPLCAWRVLLRIAGSDVSRRCARVLRRLSAARRRGVYCCVAGGRPSRAADTRY